MYKYLKNKIKPRLETRPFILLRWKTRRTGFVAPIASRSRLSDLQIYKKNGFNKIKISDLKAVAKINTPHVLQ